MEASQELTNWIYCTRNILNHYKYHLIHHKSKIKRVLFVDVIKHFVKNNGDLSKLESCLGKILRELSISGIIQTTNNDNYRMRFSFHLLKKYTCSNDLYKSFAEKGKFITWKQTIQKWKLLLPKSDEEIVVVYTPHIGKISSQFQKENDYHCRLIVSIFLKNGPAIFGLYDCNGPIDDAFEGISGLHSLLIGNLGPKDFEENDFLNGITDLRTCLHGRGYFLNQWIKFESPSGEQLDQSCCYFFTIWAVCAATIAIIWNKYKFIKYLLKLQKMDDINDRKDVKHDLVLLLAYDMQMLLISNLIQDAREHYKYKVTMKKLESLKGHEIQRGARCRECRSKKNLMPKKQFAIVFPRNRRQQIGINSKTRIWKLFQRKKNKIEKKQKNQKTNN